jgi:hypothetical protein
MKADPSVALRPQDDSLLRDLAASARPTGGPAIAAARERCTRELRQLGYEVSERPFTYSSLPGRYATPMFGASVAILVGFAGTQALEGGRFLPAVILVLGGVALALAGRWFARHGVLEIPLLREAGVNLECTLPGDAPRVWLCAHLDSKSQPIPTLVRSAGIVTEAVGFLSALAAAVAGAAGVAVHDFFWAFAGVVTLIGTIPVGLSMVGTQSPGALDNASGVTAVIAAARMLERRVGVGVLITDAEELGLAGARAWVQGRKDDVVLNCDGVDDEGEVTIMNSSPAMQFFDAASSAAKSQAIHVDFNRMFPGVLMDSVAFTDAGIASVTVSRGTVGSFARVHSERDNLERLRGDGIAPTAVLLAEMAGLLASAPKPGMQS